MGDPIGGTKTAASHELITASIDGRDVKVPHGTTILTESRRLGVRIPTLCFDRRLKPWGGCRLCIVEVEGARAPVASCATAITDGMVVRTDTEELRRLRKTILELILSDHPNECMTCDAGGACELQDLAYEYGTRWDRFARAGDEETGLAAFTPARGERAVEDGNPFIWRDYDKCILCGRCARICDEVQQSHVYDFLGRGFTGKVSTPYDRGLIDTQCELCGQCVSTCPVGALLPRRSLGKGRAWQLERTRTVCPYCGCGCVIDLVHREGRIVGVSGVEDAGPGWGNLCIKGRFAWQFIESPDRLVAPLVRTDTARATGIAELTTDAGEPAPHTQGGERFDGFVAVSWDDALGFVGQRLASIKAERGPDAVAGLASAKCTNEENYAFQKFVRAVVGTNNVDHCARL